MELMEAVHAIEGIQTPWVMWTLAVLVSIGISMICLFLGHLVSYLMIEAIYLIKRLHHTKIYLFITRR